MPVAFEIILHWPPLLAVVGVYAFLCALVAFLALFGAIK